LVTLVANFEDRNPKAEDEDEQVLIELSSQVSESQASNHPKSYGRAGERELAVSSDLHTASAGQGFQVSGEASFGNGGVRWRSEVKGG
jgi:hypothetical protein